MGFCISVSYLLTLFLSFASTLAITAPAWESVPLNSTSGAALFEYETSQLTESVLKHLAESDDTKAIAPFLDFGVSGTASNSTDRCKLLPGDKDWPSNAEWSTFNDLAGETLIATVPIASPCYHNWGNYDAAECASIVETWSGSSLHTEDPTSVMQPLFQGRTCMPSEAAAGNCTLGGFPSYFVNVSNVAQIQLAVNYARNRNLRLIIKNTGHDGFGKSVGKGALSLWTHNLKDIQFLPELELEGYKGPALKLAAGVQLFEVYEAAEKYGVTAVGGICVSIGYAGGYILGGGHSPLGSQFGMAADQILAIEAVTASGHFVTVTESSNKDLFWALRGGGGGAFAIATSVTIRVYPKVPATISAFSFALAGNITEATFFAGIRAYWGHFIRFADAGTWSHFWLTNSSTGVSFAIEPFYAPYHTVDKFNELLQPFFDELKILGIPITVNTTYTEEFLSGFGSVGLVDFGGGTLRAGLRIFPRKNWEDEQKLDETFEAMMLGMRAGGFSLGWTIAPRQVAGTENSVAPFWRTAVAIVNAGIPVADNATVEEVEEGSRQLEQILDQWRAVAPNSEGGGVYLNEADPEEPDWQHSFYGTAYERLLEIKHQVDPWGVFYGLTAVGSEEWEVYDGDRGIQTQDGRLCRK